MEIASANTSSIQTTAIRENFIALSPDPVVHTIEQLLKLHGYTVRQYAAKALEQGYCVVGCLPFSARTQVQRVRK
jgi:hypothetical protein